MSTDESQHEINPAGLVGSRLREARKKMRLTQKQLADGMDVSQNTIAQWETGKRTISLVTIINACRFLDASPAWIAFGERGLSLLLPARLRLKIEEAAKKTGRSEDDEVIERVDESLLTTEIEELGRLPIVTYRSEVSFLDQVNRELSFYKDSYESLLSSGNQLEAQEILTKATKLKREVISFLTLVNKYSIEKKNFFDDNASQASVYSFVSFVLTTVSAVSFRMSHEDKFVFWRNGKKAYFDANCIEQPFPVPEDVFNFPD